MKHPRIMTTIRDHCTYEILKKLSKQKKKSVSQVIYDLVEDSLERIEDAYWAKEAERIMAETKPEDWMSHDQFWKEVEEEANAQ